MGYLILQNYPECDYYFKTKEELLDYLEKSGDPIETVYQAVKVSDLKGEADV